MAQDQDPGASGSRNEQTAGRTPDWLVKWLIISQLLLWPLMFAVLLWSVGGRSSTNTVTVIVNDRTVVTATPVTGMPTPTPTDKLPESPNGRPPIPLLSGTVRQPQAGCNLVPSDVATMQVELFWSEDPDTCDSEALDAAHSLGQVGVSGTGSFAFAYATEVAPTPSPGGPWNYCIKIHRQNPANEPGLDPPVQYPDEDYSTLRTLAVKCMKP